MSKLCLCLTSPTLSGAMMQLERYRDCIDMAELRLDLLNPYERKKAGDLPALLDMPLILSVRLPEDGGRWGLNGGEDEKEREALLVSLLSRGGWNWVDLEYERPMASVCDAAESAGTRIIRSVHDFNGDLLNRPTADTASMIRSMAGDGAIPKLAATCTGSRQLLSLARLAVAVDDIGEKVILGMGEYGAPSRILANRTGSLWTYASSIGNPQDPPAAAPGQLDPRTMRELYRFGEIGKNTPLYAVVGNPVAHSRSPQIHNAWLRETGSEGTYLPMRADDAAAMLETCDLWGIRGLSVTVPLKERVLALCDYAGVLARKIGAANTLLRAGDGWRARNTDAEGFLNSLSAALGLESAAEMAGMRALIIGAGGAARAAVHSLIAEGVSLIILNRTVDKAKRLAEEVDARWGGLGEDSGLLLSDGVDFVVQTTNAGMPPFENVDPLPWWNFSSCRLAYDMVYEPEETVFLSRARKAGVAVMNGSSMLINQARLQFKLYTGKTPPLT